VSSHTTLLTSDFDNLLTPLDVSVVSLAECHVAEGWRLSFPPIEFPCIHYSFIGQGRIGIGDRMPIPLTPHKLIVSPPRQPFWIDTVFSERGTVVSNIVKAQFPIADSFKRIDNFVAGEGAPALVMACGYFRTSYATSVDLFDNLISPIVEQFNDRDELAYNFKSAMTELSAEKVGMRAMTTAILKRVLVTVLRQFLSSADSQLERFTMLTDPQLARAFAEMAGNPGAFHSVESLSRIAGLSRSVFMARFTRAYGDSPMSVLRQLRMRQAASLLKKSGASIERVARSVGYESRSSFFRAFREAYGTDPSDYAKQRWERKGHPMNSNEISDLEKVKKSFLFA